MRRIRVVLLLLTAALAVVAQTRHDSGVSLALAQHRAATIHDLEYSLTFVIPDDKQADIEAVETVRFRLDEADEVVLDFREDAAKIVSVVNARNNRPLDWRYENEHIVIPKKATRRGLNQIRIAFVAGNQSLNRSDEYMYTLFVPDRARTCFPCFDQPDLKALFALTLDIPAEWTAVANEPLKEVAGAAKGRRRLSNDAQGTDGKQAVLRDAHKPIPTYLFAFATGRFEYQESTQDGRTIGAYYRETDPARTAQLPEIFRQVHFALRWLEDFTAQPYAFPKYDMVILPGFQFGGMEHTGCTFYNDNTLFLTPTPTPDETLARSNLIAHETAHMWFGDLVTMRWFNDVWTKEVFANYFAAEITHPQFPEVNYDIYWLRNFKQAAVAEDRTDGRTAIQQRLDNLADAGLIYNNIIYNKAPLVMREMVGMMGNDAFKRGIRRYIRDFAYGNASWDDLIGILDTETPADLKAYSEQWVKQPHYPTIVADSHRPNPQGRQYGFVEMTREQTDSLMACWATEPDATAKQSFLMTLYENYLAGNIADREWCDFLLGILQHEAEPLTVATSISYLKEPIWRLDKDSRATLEAALWELAQTHESKACQLQLIRFLSANGCSDETNKQMYVLWRYADNDLLSVNDYMTMAYELALRYPTLARDIIAEEHDRIINPDRQRQFEYISRAVSPDAAACDSLFRWLLVPDNRRIEPWAGSALYYLNHPLRDVESARFIRPALEALQEVQRTGDIFFPSRWCSSLLQGHRSAEARAALEAFLNAHDDYPPLLKNKILTAAHTLMNSKKRGICK